MADVRQFIALAAESLGIDESTARSATSGLLGFLEAKLERGDFRSLLAELGGADELIGQKGTPGGGLLGGVAKLAGGVLGGKAGAAVGVVSALTDGGLDVGQVTRFVGQFLAFAKSNLSADLVKRVLAGAPELRGVAD
ncbi:MAG: hypothetical protein ACT4PE_18540 [Candidatus Eiseniibacteriota bacterium]